MLVSVEFADVGTKSGTHRVLIIGRGSEDLEAGDIGLRLEEAKTLISAIKSEFLCAQAAEISTAHVESVMNHLVNHRLSKKQHTAR